jgi:RNA polymerase sigma factor (sigma-70 family)
MGRAKFILIVQLIWLAALVPAMVLGVQRNGIVGAAVAHVVVIGPIVLPIYLFGLRKITDLTSLAKAGLPPLVAASTAALAAASVASRFTDPLVQLIAGLAVGGLTYMIIAIPFTITLLSQGQIAKLRAGRILHIYSSGARLIGLPAGSRPKHADKSGGGRSFQSPRHAIGDHPPKSVADARWWQDVPPRQDAATIVAGDPARLANAYDQYAVPLYGYCHWMLREPTDAADAVEHAFVTAATQLHDLGDSGELRSRLYAVARDVCCHRRFETAHPWPTDAVSQPADFSGNARQAEVRRLILATLAELNPRQREVVELSLRHNLDDADLATVLGMSWSQAHALSSDARSHLENALRVLFVTRTGRETCPWLDELLAGWDAQLTTRMRDLVGLHVEQCQACARYRRRTLRPEALFSLLPTVTPPLALRERVLERCAGVTRDAPTYHRQVTQPIELLLDSWFPRRQGR